MLLALDPSMRATGWVIVRIDTGELMRAGAIETEARCGRDDWALERVHDAGRCGLELAEAIQGLVNLLPHPSAVALEGPLGSQDAIAAADLARANQAVRCGIHFADLRPELVVTVSSYAAKRAATGTKRPKDPKGDVRRGVEARYGVERMATLASVARTLRGREGIYDAAAVAMRALKLGAVRALIELEIELERILEA
jgi:Holliday junction resolvasome RuvABC endonuclease subunit